jgi:hypothetical protein
MMMASQLECVSQFFLPVGSCRFFFLFEDVRRKRSCSCKCGVTMQLSDLYSYCLTVLKKLLFANILCFRIPYYYYLE